MRFIFRVAYCPLNYRCAATNLRKCGFSNVLSLKRVLKVYMSLLNYHTSFSCMMRQFVENFYK